MLCCVVLCCVVLCFVVFCCVARYHTIPALKQTNNEPLCIRPPLNDAVRLLPIGRQVFEIQRAFPRHAKRLLYCVGGGEYLEGVSVIVKKRRKQ